MSNFAPFIVWLWNNNLQTSSLAARMLKVLVSEYHFLFQKNYLSDKPSRLTGIEFKISSEIVCKKLKNSEKENLLTNEEKKNPVNGEKMTCKKNVRMFI